MYKGNIGFILWQSNLERNCLEKYLLGKVNKICDNYRSNISSKNLNKAFQKVDEVKNLAGKSIAQMAANMEQTEQLLAHSQEA